MHNEVTLIGNLGLAPEVKTLENGTIVARLSLATNDGYYNKQNEWVEKSNWHNIILWNKLGERAGKQLQKGHMVLIKGKIEYRKFEKEDGTTQYITDIVASKMRRLTKVDGAEKFIPTEVQSNTPAVAASDAFANQLESKEAAANDDDLPF